MTWKIKGRLAGVLFLMLAFVSANAGYSIAPAQAGAGDPVIAYDPLDDRMTAAETAARGELTKFFLLVLDEEGHARPDAGIKVAIPVAGGGHEVIWVSPFASRDGQFIGLLANEPQALGGLKAGDAVTFDESQVRDWFFIGEDNKMYGSFTTRAMLTDMTLAAAQEVRDVLSETPLPDNW